MEADRFAQAPGRGFRVNEEQVRERAASRGAYPMNGLPPQMDTVLSKELSPDKHVPASLRIDRTIASLRTLDDQVASILTRVSTQEKSDGSGECTERCLTNSLMVVEKQVDALAIKILRLELELFGAQLNKSEV